MSIIHKLPFSTADCDSSPKLSFELGQLTIDFDYQGMEVKEYAALHFAGAVRVSFTPDPMVSESMIDAYSRVCEYADSDWLHEYRNESDQPTNTNHKHFRVYFDHYGCVDVIAKSWRLGRSDSKL